jgi:hypothetical protein
MGEGKRRKGCLHRDCSWLPGFWAERRKKTENSKEEFQDGEGFQCFEEELQGVIVLDNLVEESQGWDSFFKVNGFKRT